MVTVVMEMRSIMGDAGGYYGVVYRMIVRDHRGDVMEWDDK